MDASIDAVRMHYDADPAQEWARLDNHPFEFALTTWMMEKYVNPGDRVLDIGGGPGRYAIHFAQKGCDVTLADLSQGNVDLARQKATEAGVALRAYACNCLDLDTLPPGVYDHVFLMGPLYHLQNEADRVAAVQAALRRLKPGGVLYVSFILTFAGILYDLQNPGYIADDCQNPDCMRLIDNMAAGENYVGPGFTNVCFYHQRQIEPFMQQFGLRRLHLFGQEGFVSSHDQSIRTRTPEEQHAWLELCKRFLELPELLSHSEHAMYIAQKL